MAKHYKNEQLMKFLVVIGAIIGLVTLILDLAGLESYKFFDPNILEPIFKFIIGLVVVVLTFLVALKPDKPLPFHWLVLIILAILLVLFGAGIWACVLVIIAALIGLIEDL